MRTLHSPEIQLSPYNVLKSSDRPADVSEMQKYNKDNDSDAYRNYRLKDLFFKASYNSACIGNNIMNNEMVELVIKRGCRYIDFEVYKSKDILYVSKKKSESSKLINVIGVINKSLIGSDPLFINLRLMSDNITDFKGQIPDSIIGLLYNGRKIDNTTRISEVQGKCIIITDRNIPGITSILSGCNDTMCAYGSSDIIQFSGNETSTKLTVVNPDNSRILEWLFGGIFNRFFNANDPDTEILAKQYKTNIIPFRFYTRPKTNKLLFYEKIFAKANCTIVPLKTLTSAYLQKIKDD
jgi:hypothetical protein